MRAVTRAGNRDGAPPQTLRGDVVRLCEEAGEVWVGDDGILGGAWADAIHPGTTVLVARHGEGGARDLLCVQGVWAALRVVVTREGARESLGSKLVAEAVLVVWPERTARSSATHFWLR